MLKLSTLSFETLQLGFGEYGSIHPVRTSFRVAARGVQEHMFARVVCPTSRDINN